MQYRGPAIAKRAAGVGAPETAETAATD